MKHGTPSQANRGPKNPGRSVQPPPKGTGIGSAIEYNGSGNFTAKYNYIHGMPADGIDLGAGNQSPTIEYNLFDGLGYTSGAHPDPVQFVGDDVNNALIAFNTIYQPQGVMANDGLTIHAQSGSTITDSTLANNVVIATGPNMSISLNIGLFQDTGNVLNGAVVTNNYLDPTATFTSTGFGDTASEVEGANLTISNNVNLLTGDTTAPTAGTFATSDISGIVASPDSGTEVTGDSVTFTVKFDQAMTVTGTPTLSLNNGGAAIYTGGSGTSALTFNYTVGTNDHSVSALAITQLSLPSGATIKNSLGDDANVSAAATTFPDLGLTDTNSFGSTSLEGIGNNYFLYAAGTTTGPELQYNGTAVTVGEFGAWAPIGAVQTANGYEVAWKLSGSNLFTVWNTDSNGNYLSNPIGSVSGTSIALETMETTFNQDLNGDGVVGQYAAPNTTLQISQSLTDASGAATIGAHATLELTAADSAPVTFAASTGMLKVDQPSTFSSEIFGFTGDGTLSSN
jgi:Tryptophan-rich Synechocystis species C-terminal domain